MKLLQYGVMIIITCVLAVAMHMFVDNLLYEAWELLTKEQPTPVTISDRDTFTFKTAGKCYIASPGEMTRETECE